MIKLDLTAMFDYREPWDCSNSVANLGPLAGELTWACATEVASAHERWLETTLDEAIAEIRRDALATGAWTEQEIDAWSETECLAYLVQCVASDMRLIGSDSADLETCVETYASTDWDREPEYPRTHLYMENGRVKGEWSE